MIFFFTFNFFFFIILLLLPNWSVHMDKVLKICSNFCMYCIYTFVQLLYFNLFVFSLNFKFNSNCSVCIYLLLWFFFIWYCNKYPLNCFPFFLIMLLFLDCCSFNSIDEIPVVCFVCNSFHISIVVFDCQYNWVVSDLHFRRVNKWSFNNNEKT